MAQRQTRYASHSDHARGQVYLRSIHLKAPNIMDYLTNLLYP